jgi:hypothetical protein
MHRLAARGPFALVLFAAASAGVGRAQPGGPAERVDYLAKKGGAVQVHQGDIKVDATGVRLTTSDKKQIVVSAADVVRAYPLDLPILPTELLTPLITAETAKEWDKARAGYEALKEKFKTGTPDRFRKWLAFRLAYTTARSADDAPADAGWKDKAEAGAKLLADYLADYPGGWEAWAATRTAARIGHELGNPEAAARLWAKAAKAADLTPALKVEAAYQEADALARAGRLGDAAARAAEALPAAAAGTARDRLNLFVLANKSAANPAEAAAAVEAEIGKTRDPAVRAAGYALVGELFLKANRPRDAMWALLWVDVVYNQDKDEVAKALARLVAVFKLLNDEERERQFQDRMRRNRGLLL